jgi:outer membrane protein OmpA-like peptidoglycan-associated protein
MRGLKKICANATRHLLLMSMVWQLAACQSVSFLPQDDEKLLYALGTRDGVPSVLNDKASPLCPALVFQADQYEMSGRHRLRLAEIAEKWKEEPRVIRIVGYCPSELPPDYARALSERRALGVREYLIEQGVDAAKLHTMGLGNDFGARSPTTGVVVLY